MKREFEIIPQGTFKYLHVFLVQMVSRTPHIHKEIELGLVLNGQVTMQGGRQSWKLEKDGIYLVNSMEAHEFIANDPDTLILAIQVSPKLLTPFIPDASLRRYVTDPPVGSHFHDAPHALAELRGLCVELAKQYHQGAACYELTCFSLIARILLILEKQVPRESIGRKSYDAARRRMDRMMRIVDFIDQNFQRKLLLKEIAEMNSLSLTYVSHLFRDVFGVTFQDYLKEKRFEYAFPLITNTDHTILDITMESGFSDERYLTRLFKERTGRSPREYRKNSLHTPRRETTRAGSTQRILTKEEAQYQLAQYRALRATE